MGLFLQPLSVAPVAVQLARVRLALACVDTSMQWWIPVLLKAKMSFIEP